MTGPRKTATRKTSSNKSKALNESVSPAVVDAYYQEPDDVVEMFAELFGDSSEDFKVELFRDQPIQFQGADIRGFCSELSPGASLQAIKSEYGGGAFHIQKRNGLGRIVMRRNFRIAGFPVAAPPASSAPAPDSGADEQPDETDKAWERRIQRLLATKALLEPTPSGAESALSKMIPLIIPALVERLFAPQEGALDQIAKVKDMMDSFRSEASIQTDSPWVAALTKFADLLAEKRSERRPVPTVAPVRQIEPRPVAPVEVAPSMGFQEAAQVAVETIVNGYIAEPRVESVALVPVLELQLNTDANPLIRDQIKPHKETFWNMVRLYHSELIEATPELVTDLRGYFDSVFDYFCSPETMEGIGGETTRNYGPDGQHENLSDHKPGSTDTAPSPGEYGNAPGSTGD